MSEPYLKSPDRFLEQISRWPTARSKAWTERFVDSAVDDENIMAVVAVGSAVRPAVTSVELDLVVVCQQPSGFSAKPPMEVDLRTYPAGQVDSLISGGNDLLGWAVNFGRVLFQREAYWDAVVEAWRRRLPIPAVDMATQRAEDAFRRLRNVLALDDPDGAHEQALSYVTHLARAELLKREFIRRRDRSCLGSYGPQAVSKLRPGCSA
jgi:hypothetical protein